MLRNEKYRGVYIYNRRAAKDANGKFNSHSNKYDDEIIRIEDGMPRIVSNEVFNSVQKIVASRKHLKSYGTKNIYLLTGKIFCGNCGCAYCGGTRFSGKKHTPYSSYTCTKKQRLAGIKCKTMEIRKEYIEEFVLKEILRVILSEDKIPALVERYKEFQCQKLSSVDNEVETIQNNIATCETQIKNLVSVIAKSGSTALLSALSELEDEKLKLTTELEVIKNNINLPDLDETQIIEAYKKARTLFLNGSTEEKRQLVNLYLDKIFVYDEYVEVYVNALPQNLLVNLIKSTSKSSKNEIIVDDLNMNNIVYYGNIDDNPKNESVNKARNEAIPEFVADCCGRGDKI